MLHFYLLEVRSSCSVTCAATKRKKNSAFVELNFSRPDFKSCLSHVSPWSTSDCRDWLERIYCNIRRGRWTSSVHTAFVNDPFQPFLEVLYGCFVVVGFGQGQQLDCARAYRADRRLFTSSIVPAHTQWWRTVCVSVFKSCQGVGKDRGWGRLGIAAADEKLHFVKSLTPTASFSSLTWAVSLLLNVVCVVIVDFF